MSQIPVKVPASLLIVCVGNTCRSPMAEALARRRWPKCAIKSAGICVPPENVCAADEAIATMLYFGIDISNHKPTSINEVAVDDYEFILAMDKRVRRALLKDGVSASKIIDLYVADPYGDAGQYHRCAMTIKSKLSTVSFPQVSN